MTRLELLDKELIRLHENYKTCVFSDEREEILKEIGKITAIVLKEKEEENNG